MKPVPFPDVDRCRQLLGEEAETMTDAEELQKETENMDTRTIIANGAALSRDEGGMR